MSTPEPINSAGNSTVKRIRRLLKSARARRDESAFVIEGMNSVSMLLHPEQKRIPVEALIIAESRAGESELAELIDLRGDARLIVMDDALMGRLHDLRSGTGIMAIAGIPPPPPPPAGRDGKFILLDNLGDPGNMGAIIRSAVGLGMSGIMLYGRCVDVYNPKCVRSTAGMLPFIDIVDVGDDDLRRLVEGGYRLVLAAGGDGIALSQWTPPARLIIAVGSEAHGISSGLRAIDHESVHIPLSPLCESLNAAIAAAIIMNAVSTIP